MKIKPIVRIGAPLPDVINDKLDSFDRDRVAKKDNNFYVVDKQNIFTKGLLTISQIDYQEILEWELWVNISAVDYLQMLESINKGKAYVEGILVSPAFFYKNIEGIKVGLEYFLKDSATNLPNIIVLNNHEDLYQDYTFGMIKSKYLEWQSKLLGKPIEEIV